jgi:copper oxidase (laccase) domain-containing protein
VVNKIYQYSFGEHVLNGTDISCPIDNYNVKYGGEPLRAQLMLLERLGIQHLFDRRAVMGAVFGNSVLKITDLECSGYDSESRSRCSGYDGVITNERNLPLMTGWGDCPELLVAGKNTVGIVHSTGKTLDRYILDNFFKLFFETEDPADTKVGFSPYIFPGNYTGDFRDLTRFNEWSEAGLIRIENGVQHMNLAGMNAEDLLRLGVLAKNIHNKCYNSYQISIESNREGGYAVSHRHAANTPGTREGRGAACIMLKD